MENKCCTRFLISWVSLSITVYQLCYCMPSTNVHANQDYYTNKLEFSTKLPLNWNMDNKDSRDNSLSSIDLSLDDEHLEDTKFIRDWLKRGSLRAKSFLLTKRKGHEVARMFMTSSTACIIINSKGEVTESNKLSTCDTYGKFCHKVSGSSLQLHNIQTGKYLAINSKGLIYSSNDPKSKDTILTDVIADHNNFSIYVYKIIKAKKCYVSVNANSVLQSCSLSPKPLKPRLLGTCS